VKNAVVNDIEELPAILNIEQVQQFLGISRPKAYELANMAGFPAVRIGRVIRVPREALMRWLDAQLQLPPPRTMLS
jgi:excisionase family DNA binding protein